MKAPTPCLEPNCNAHVTAGGYGYCAEHKRPPWHGSTRKGRLPKDWATRRLIVMKRDNGVCHLCGNPGADTIDHIVAGDNHELTNLAPVHDRVAPHCHRYKTATESRDTIKRKH